MKKPKFRLPKFKLETVLRVLPFMTLSISAVTTGTIAFYLYQNVIIASNDAVALQSLSQDVVKTRLNTNLFEEVNDDFTRKTGGEEIDVNTLRNPFEEVLDKTAPTENIEENSEEDPIDAAESEEAL